MKGNYDVFYDLIDENYNLLTKIGRLKRAIDITAVASERQEEYMKLQLDVMLMYSDYLSKRIKDLLDNEVF